LIYGKHPILSFDYNDRTWDTLDWDTVRDTADLLAIRAQQILRRDKDLVLALEKQKAERQCSVDAFNKKFGDALTSGDFDVGTWVLVHESWLDAQHGNKGALRWSGPYIVHAPRGPNAYTLRELDGTVLKGSFTRNRVKLFYYRDDHQSIRSVTPAHYAVHSAAATSKTASSVLEALHPEIITNAKFPVSVLPSVTCTLVNADLFWFPIVSVPGRARYRLPRLCDLTPGEGAVPGVRLLDVGTGFPVLPCDASELGITSVKTLILLADEYPPLR
jgi:hypothetical protein